MHRGEGKRATRKALARHGPMPPASHHDRRLLGATSGGTTAWLGWCADQAWRAFPPPAEGTLSLVGDRPRKPTRGPQHPVAQHTRLSHPPPYGFGCRLVRRMAPGGVCRLPVDCARRRRTAAPRDRPEPARCRQRLPECPPPAWGQEGILVAPAAYAARDNLALSQALGYGEVLACPRLWKFTPGQALNALGTPLPRWWSSPIRRPTAAGRRRPCWG